MSGSHRFHLADLNLAIKEALTLSFEDPIWIIAEIARINANYSGHTYIDLVEKRGADTLAQAKATIWRSNSRILTDYSNATGQPLKPGIQVLLFVRVDFHPVYGLSLNVIEIDPSYSLGEMARKRQEVLDRLQTEGLLDLNRGLDLALVPQRIAVISSATAAGWEDFRGRLVNNLYGYGFTLTLFPSVMQGDGAEVSLLAAIQMVWRDAAEFDLVTIIRGGGGVVDLSCFDTYPLAKAIATFPLPVITGIGHERDTSVADIVAFHRADTPTAAAEYIVARIGQFEVALLDATDRLVEIAANQMQARRLELANVAADLLDVSQSRLNAALTEFADLLHRTSVGVRTKVNAHTQVLTELATRIDMRAVDYCKEFGSQLSFSEAKLVATIALRMERTGRELEHIDNTIRLRDPLEALRRGFSVTRVNGKAVRSVLDLPPGTDMCTTIQDGTVLSTVKEQP